MVCQDNFGREREGRGAEQVLQVDVRTLRQGRCRGGPSRQAGQSGNRGVYQRRRAGREGARRLGWKPEVAENLAHDVSGLDRSDHGHATGAAGTGEHVEVKDAAQAPPARGMPPRLGGEAPDPSRAGATDGNGSVRHCVARTGSRAPALTRAGGAVSSPATSPTPPAGARARRARRSPADGPSASCRAAPAAAGAAPAASAPGRRTASTRPA